MMCRMFRLFRFLGMVAGERATEDDGGYSAYRCGSHNTRPLPGGGLIVPSDGFLMAYRKSIIQLAAQYRVPTIYGIRAFSAEGGLVSYGVEVSEQNHQAAGYVDRILRGEKAGDLPVQEPTNYQLVINLKTAKALGLNIPQPMLLLADEVIE